MKRYGSIERDKPFNFADRLSRLLEFDFRVQFSVENGVDACLSLVVFGHGITLGLTRGMPHIVGGVSLGVSALTERFEFTFGFQSDWYDDYMNDLFVNADIAPTSGDVSFLLPSVFPTSPRPDGWMGYDDPQYVPAYPNTILGDGVTIRATVGEVQAGALDSEGRIKTFDCGDDGCCSHDDPSGIADDDNPQYIGRAGGQTLKPCILARHRDIGCGAECAGRA